MAASSSISSKVSLKLLIDTKTRKVLFAEANKEFVNFLFYILSIPLGTVVRLLGTNSMVGSLGTLYDSLENLSNRYMQPNQCKESILNTKNVNFGVHVPLLLPDDEVFTSRKFYGCQSCHGHFSNVDDVSKGWKSYSHRKKCRETLKRPKSSYTWRSQVNHVTDDPTAECPQCYSQMKAELTYVSGDGTVEDGGFVKGMVTYIGMDDLVVNPLSITSGLTILNSLNVKEVGGLEEKVVSLEMKEGLMLLKASLQCKNVLNSVLLA